MAGSNDGDPQDSKEVSVETSFEHRVNVIRRQLSDCAEELDFVYSYAKKSVPDVPTASSSAKNNLSAMKGNLDLQYLRYSDLWKELGQLHDINQTSQDFPNETDKKQKQKVRSDYYTALGKIHAINGENLERTRTENLANATLAETRPAKNLPKMNLPTFDGQLLNWPKFRDSFNAMVHTEKLPAIEKFQYLRASLKGPALSTITSFKVEDANYELAWQAILDTYDNKRMLASAYLDQLLSFKPIQGKASPDNLNQFLSTISDTVAAFKQLGVPDAAQFILFHLSIRCLDGQTREMFETRQSTDTFPTFDALAKFVRERSIALQLAGASNPFAEIAPKSPSTFQNFSKASRPPKPITPRTSTSLVANKVSSPKKEKSVSSVLSIQVSSCVACKGEAHHLLNCHVFNETSGAERRRLLKDWLGCVNCLSHKHQILECPSKWHCRFCPERHHASLHPPSQNNASPASGNRTVLFESASLSVSTGKEDYILLGTAIATMMDGRGQFQSIRLVIDCGSQSSFITHRCCNRLGLEMSKTDRLISGIGQTPYEGAKGKVFCTLKPKDKGSVQISTEAVVVSTITAPLPSIVLPQSVINKCRRVKLADPTFYIPGPIDFLLGADIFTDIWTGAVKEVGSDGPKLISSIFGFIVIGRVNSGIPSTSTTLLVMDNSTNINFQLERFWQQEEPVLLQAADPEDEQCEEHFCQTHYRLENGRYGVHLPFREHNSRPGESSSMALRRFYSQEKKLLNNPVMRQKYSEFMSEYLQMNHMSPARRPSKFLIPHHCILKYSPEGPKLKVVFDASANVIGGSLNQHLLTGKKLQNEIRDIILRFRYHSIAFSTDIVKMFRMIEMSPEDRQFMHIYWRFNPDQPVERYELNTLIYGLVCAPYLAQRVLRQLVIDHGNEFPLAAKAVLQDSYVDDFLTGASSIPAALALQQQLVQLLRCGGFELSKWSSNSAALLESIQPNYQAEPVDLSTPEDQWVKILGLQWDPPSDCFLFSIGEPNSNHTKRGVLSTVARLYDPLGFLMPTTFLMKSFIQELWIHKLDWDQPMTPDLERSWSTVINQLPLLKNLKIPRFIGTSTDTTSVQIVGFSDASNKGFAAVLYLRVNSSLGCRVSLLSSKSKLAPTKPQSVPRLELAGALLLAELYSSILPQIKKLDLEIEPPAFFTDSTTALAWIRTQPHQLKVFVANRVVKIQEITSPSLWNHIASEENPADVASRGTLPSLLLNHDLWWTGPPWITLQPTNWPMSKVTIPAEVPEMKEMETCALVSVKAPDQLINWMNRFSSYLTMIRAAGWLQRWLYNLKHLKHCCCPWHSGPLTKEEFNGGLLMCIKIVQSFYFHDQKQALAKYADLKPYVDSEGVWRVGGRLRHSPLPESQKYPILLPYESHLAVLLVDYYHRIYLHPGPTTLQAVLQKHFWIPSLRRLIRVRGFRCKICYQSRANSVAPLMGDLPSYRVNGGRTFQHVGIDFAGPFPLKESNRRNAAIGKVYLCLYVCMSTKALHLEAVTRLTTEAFLASLQRFTSRRGIPTDIYTDKGSNFLGASNYLKELYVWFSSQDTKQDLLEFALTTKINWHFNPPQTPHMGGIWEAGVKSVKRYLRLIASDTNLTYEEISTWFSKIEAILNSRPLCPLSTDPNENDYLSPGHFLVGGPLVVAPEPTLLDTRENLLSRWQLVSRMSEDFWKRWSSEYLCSLQRRPKWIQAKKSLEVGDLVLLKENSPPLQWKIARVTAVHPGDDQVVRVVTVRRGNSSFTRHAVNLVPLPHLMTDSFPKSY